MTSWKIVLVLIIELLTYASAHHGRRGALQFRQLHSGEQLTADVSIEHTTHTVGQVSLNYLSNHLLLIIVRILVWHHNTLQYLLIFATIDLPRGELLRRCA